MYPPEALRSVEPWNPPAAILSEPLETDRLLIRPYTLDDAQAVSDEVNASRDALLPWCPWAAEAHRTHIQTVHYLSEQILHAETAERLVEVGLGIFEKASGRYVGSTGIHDLRRNTRSCETGYWIGSDWRGRGYAGEACARLISWVLARQPEGLGLRRVRAICSSANTASKRVLEKLGLPAEICERDEYFIDGLGVSNRLGWGVLASEWDTQNHRIIGPA